MHLIKCLKTKDSCKSRKKENKNIKESNLSKWTPQINEKLKQQAMNKKAMKKNNEINCKSKRSNVAKNNSH